MSKTYDLYTVYRGSSETNPALHLYKLTWDECGEGRDVRIATFRGAALDALWKAWGHRYCLPKQPQGTVGEDQLRVVRIGERLKSKISDREGVRLEAYSYVAKGLRDRARLAEAARQLSFADPDLLEIGFLRRIRAGGEDGKRTLRALRILVGAVA